MIRAKNIRGPWTDPIMVAESKGLIDPCPLWDESTKAASVNSATALMATPLKRSM
jgi:beta-xylosidase